MGSVRLPDFRNLHRNKRSMTDLSDIDLVAQPIKLSGSPFAVRRPTPGLGEHADEVLAEAGYGAVDIEALWAAGSV